MTFLTSSVLILKKRRRTALVLLGLMLWPLTVAAGPQEDADKLIKQGLELRRAGRDSDALPKFEQAHAVLKTPRSAAQLGLCLQALARWSEADPLLAEALTSSNDPWVKQNRETLKESLEAVKTHVARVEILGQPRGARVSVNARNVGSLPLKEAVLVNEGPVDLEVAAEGYRTEVRTLSVVGASYQRLVFRLEPEKATALAEQRPLLPVPHESDQSRGALSASSQAEPRKEEGGNKVWLWTGIGAAVVGAAVAAILLSSSSGAKNPQVNETFKFE